jgi:hypothetical protein
MYALSGYLPGLRLKLVLDLYSVLSTRCVPRRLGVCTHVFDHGYCALVDIRGSLRLFAKMIDEPCPGDGSKRT